MGQPRFEFEFFNASENQKGSLANFVVGLWVDNLCILKCKGWNIRTGQHGLYPSGPQYDSKKPDPKRQGKTQWYNYLNFFPKPYVEGETGVTEQYKAFQDQCVQAYQAWDAAGRPSSRDNQQAKPAYQAAPANAGRQAGASLAPRIPAPAAAPALPVGWTRNTDRRTNQTYFTDPSGTVYFDGDPRLGAALASVPAPKAAQPANDPFASFGSVPGR